MREIGIKVKARAMELLAEGAVSRVLGWEETEVPGAWTPAAFETAAEMAGFRYGAYAGANLSKICLKLNRAAGKTLVVLKPCDALSFNRLLQEHRLDREKFYVIGAGCKGMEDERGALQKCAACGGKDFSVSDEVIDDAESRVFEAVDRFSEVAKIEQMSPDERFAFWKKELSRCTRCNACRNVCPACSCIKCVFDNPESGVAGKANTTDFEGSAFHIIRAYHVAGRCTDCGECTRVCPQNVPLHLLNRKLIKDFNELYGDFQAEDAATPLTMYEKTDAEPGAFLERGRG